MKRYWYLILLLLSVACQKQRVAENTSKHSTLYLEEISITTLQQVYKGGKYTITDVVTDYLQRIDLIKTVRH